MNMSISDGNITHQERTYAERQLVVVASDEVVKASREAERIAVADKTKGVNWSAISEIAMTAVLGGPSRLAIEITK